LIDFILVLPLDGSAGFPLPFILPKSRARDGRGGTKVKNNSYVISDIYFALIKNINVIKIFKN
jgi:hypothetical protein